MRQYLRARMHRIQRMMQQPLEGQQKEFRHLINQASNTRWGAQFHYKSIRSIHDFQNRFPVQDYNSLQPYFQQMLLGEKNVLWPSRIQWFSKSSGTTHHSSKLIPVSKEAIYDSHVKTGKDLMAIHYHRFPDSKVFAGKSMLIGGSLQRAADNSSIQVGDVSAVLIHQLPEWLQFYREPARSIVLMQDWEKKMDAIVKTVAEANITTISGVPTWMLMILQRLLHYTGASSVADVWPHIELFVHGGVSFMPYRQQYEKIMGRPICYTDAYNASEGFFAFQIDEQKDMLLHTGNGIFYEFIPQEEWNKEFPKTVWLSEVELHKNYALVISTNAGLWRYRIGDVVQFTSLQPYKIIIAGRTAQHINVFGEEVMVHNTDRALQLTCTALDSSVKEYTVAPLHQANGAGGAHEWLIEFERAPDNLSSFCNMLDKNLQELNSDYAAKRIGNLLLQHPVLHAVPNGTFYKWMEGRNKLGGQNKVPRLANGRKYVEEILELIR